MSEATGKKAVLHLDGKEIELPIYSGTLGPDVIDVKDVLASGHFTHVCKVVVCKVPSPISG